MVGSALLSLRSAAGHWKEARDFETVARHAAQLSRVRQHLHLADTEFAQNLRADAIRLEIVLPAFERFGLFGGVERLENVDQMIFGVAAIEQYDHAEIACGDFLHCRIQ